jgi:hypothetical protein
MIFFNTRSLLLARQFLVAFSSSLTLFRQPLVFFLYTLKVN